MDNIQKIKNALSHTYVERVRAEYTFEQSPFTVLPLDQLFDLLFAQSEVFTNVSIGFTCSFPPEHFFC